MSKDKYQIINILTGKANPNTMNGVNKVVDALASEQIRIGFSSCVMGVASNTIIRHSPIYGYKLFASHSFMFLYDKEWLDFLLSNSNNDTIFHFHSVFIPWYLPLIKALKKHRRRHIVVTPHGQYVDSAMLSIKKRIFFELFDKRILQEAETVHVIGCETESNTYIKKNAKRIVVIPNGYDSAANNIFEEDLSEELVLGYLGRLESRQKGLDVLIPAFAEYRRKGGTGFLRIAGRGPSEEKLKEMVKHLQVSDYITLVGQVYDDEKWNFIRRCSAMISPSRWDGVPTSCLESSSIGCPQLITKETNLAPYVEKYGSGMVILELTVEMVADLLLNFEKIFFDKEQYKAMRIGAKNMISEELNWVNINKRIINELYGL